MTAWYDNAVSHRLHRGMLCDIALCCAQIKEDGMKTETLIELTAVIQQLTNQVKHGSGLLSHV